MGDRLTVTLFKETYSSGGDVVTTSERPSSRVEILAPKGRDLKLWKEKARGRRWYWSRESEGGGERTKAALEGANMVREGNPSVDCGARVREESFRVRAMEEYWPESERILADLRLGSEAREKCVRRRSRKTMRSEEAIDGALSKAFL